MENSRKGKICKIDVLGASFAKHLRSKEHFENKGQVGRIIPEWLFKEEQTLIKKKMKKFKILNY